jgi:hypothetical protein
MKKLFALVVASATLGLAACGGGEVVVQASVERADGAVTPLPDLVVRALPYDRDALFTELEQAHPTPQPAIPDSLNALQAEITRAQEEWSNAETIWGAARDSLKVLSDKMQGMNRASAQYNLAFRDFNTQEAVEQRTRQLSQQAFARFEQLSRRYNQESENIKLQRQQWADEAYASIDSVIDARMIEGGLKEYADTTDANGVAQFRGMKKGNYWVYARYDLPYDELYWNLPVEVGSEPVTVQLNRQTAQVRPKL